MLSETFVNRMISAVLIKHSNKLYEKEIVNSIRNITNKYSEINKEEETSKKISSKIDLLKYLVKYRYANKDKDFSIEELKSELHISKYSIHSNLIDDLCTMEFADYDIKELLEKLNKKERVLSALTNSKEIKQYLNDFETENFDDETHMIDKFESLISNVNMNIIELKKHESIKEVESLDLSGDNYDFVLNKIRESYNTQDVLHVGLKDFEKNLTSGGLENGRLYLIAGTSGVGKSMMMLNWVINNIKYREVSSINLNKKKEVHLYITAENLIHETLERIYCCVTGRSKSEFDSRINDLDKSKTIRTDITEFLRPTNSDMVVKYIPKKSKISKIESIIREIISDPNVVLKSIYIDYLDLLSSNEAISERRIELEYITMSLKNIAVEYDVPVITATQLNRSGYGSLADPKQLSESMGKFNNSDVVVFIQTPPKEKDARVDIMLNGINTTCKVVLFSLLKNRSGAALYSNILLAPEKIGDTNIYNYRFMENPSDDINKDRFFNYEELEETRTISKPPTINDNTNITINSDNAKISEW